MKGRTDELIAGVDAGTSVVKAAIFDADGAQLALASRPNRWRALPDGGAEQDMAETWKLAAETVAEVAAQVGNSRVAVLAVTGQGDGAWLLDRQGRPVGDALLWLDSRAAGIVAEFEKNGGRAAAGQFTGCGMNACNQSAQLHWLARRQPERIAAAATAMHCKDWLFFNLTGERATDPTEGVFTFGNFRTREYAPEVFAALELEPFRRLLPPIVDGARETRPLRPAAARACGLPAGTPVSLGYVDVACAALGGGADDPRAGCTIMGTTGMHIRLLPDAAAFVPPAAPSGYLMPFFDGRGIMRMHSNMAGTLNLDWLAKIARECAGLFGAETEAMEDSVLLSKMENLAERAARERTIFHPYIDRAGERGPFLNPEARAQFSGLSSEAGAGELARAVFEGLAFAGRHCYAALGEFPAEIRATGGAARSALFRRMLADAMGAPVRTVRRAETGIAGAMMAGATAVDIFSSIGDACKKWVAPLLDDGVSPNPDAAGRRALESRFAAYALAAEAMPPVWTALARAESERAGGRAAE